MAALVASVDSRLCWPAEAASAPTTVTSTVMITLPDTTVIVTAEIDTPSLCANLSLIALSTAGDS